MGKNYKVIKINGKSIREHRYIMGQYLGRKLNYNEVIHHENGDIRDNRIENLKLMPRSEHSSIHKIKVRRIVIKCARCGKNIKLRKKEYNEKKMKRKQENIYCSTYCVGKAVGFKYKDIDNIIKKGLSEGKTGYQIAKEFKLNKKTVYTHIKSFKED